MSCIYGRRQMGTEDQGWVAHFAIRALRGEPVNIFGDGCQVRDILDVSDAVDAYVAAWQHIGAVCGRAYNLGGGPDECRQPSASSRPHRFADGAAGGDPLGRLASRRSALLRL